MIIQQVVKIKMVKQSLRFFSKCAVSFMFVEQHTKQWSCFCRCPCSLLRDLSPAQARSVRDAGRPHSPRTEYGGLQPATEGTGLKGD